jgi:heme-degrading monooxygenase HmoA
MITVTRSYHRTSTEMPWHLEQPYEAQIYTQEFKDHVQDTYGNVLVHQMNGVVDLGLTLNFQSIWQTQQDYEAYLNDPICQAAWARRDAHNAQYGITSTPSVITEM